jgi:hypothetical protein
LRARSSAQDGPDIREQKNALVEKQKSLDVKAL